MRKLLFVLLSVFTLTAFADDNASDLVFLFKDGSTQRIEAENLQMTFNDGLIIADNGSMSLDIPLATLQQFYFSSTTGIDTVINDLSDWTLFDLKGREVGKCSTLSICPSLLPAGMYIAKSATTTIKIAVK